MVDYKTNIIKIIEIDKGINKYNNNYFKILRLFLEYYLGYTTSIAFNKLDSINRKLVDAFTNEEFKVIDKLKNIKVKEYCLFDLVYSDLAHRGVKGFEKEYDYFKKHNTDSVYAQQIRKLYAKMMALAPGKVAPPFTCMDVTGKVVSLNDFKGKYVYLDFWTTWCGECRKEIPHLIKLQSEYKAKNVVFVSISLDRNFQVWKKFVIEKK
jgi:hypothetical protein